MDFKSIFNGESLTLEQFQERTKSMKLADLSTGDYVDKGRFSDQKAELERLKGELAERDVTISNLEKASGDADAIRNELERYKREEADRKKAEKEAETDRILTAAAEQALEGKEFVNDFTRTHFLSELKKAIADPANKDKTAAALFADMTKDLDGIFRNPQQEPLRIPGVDKHDAKTMTKDEIFAIKDASERQAAIAANSHLFIRKDE